MDASFALVEVTRVLMEDGGENGVGDHGADETVGGGGAEAFGVTLHALAVSTETVLPLFDASDDRGNRDGDWIDGRLEGKVKLLSGAESDRVLNVGNVEVGEDTEDTLLFFKVHLVLGEIVTGDDHFDGGVR